MRTQLLLLSLVVAASFECVMAAEPVAPEIELGSRRELFIDDYLIERLSGKAELRLQQPQPCDLALVHDAPWEGSGCGYHSVFQDRDRYRMYYKAWHLDV